MRVAFLACFLLCRETRLWCQAPAPSAGASATSLSASIQGAKAAHKEFHIFYVHGMGIEPRNVNKEPQDFEVSYEFRAALCLQIKCKGKIDSEAAPRGYAKEHYFNPKNAPPPLSYFGQSLWIADAKKDDWNAAAPFVVHYKLDLTDGDPIYVDEINWWPLVLSAKCRQIIAAEAALIGADKTNIKTCSAPTRQDPLVKDATRYTSYNWLADTKLGGRGAGWPAPALINRSLKQGIMDWGFADAVLAVGSLHKYLVEGIREAALDGYDASAQREYVIVSDSLGSYLMFTALDLQSDPDRSVLVSTTDWRPKLDAILSQTSRAYFMANQVRLLELANLDDSSNKSLAVHLQNWLQLRPKSCPPAIVAWSDPSDLLTFQVPEMAPAGPDGATLVGVTVKNLPARNAWRWFGLIEDPKSAHTKYDQNRRIIREMLKGEKTAGCTDKPTQ